MAEAGVYFLQRDDRLKIGQTGFLSGRLKAYPEPRVLLGFLPCKQYQARLDLESALLRQFEIYRVRGEWHEACDESLAMVTQIIEADKLGEYKRPKRPDPRRSRKITVMVSHAEMEVIKERMRAGGHCGVATYLREKGLAS